MHLWHAKFWFLIHYVMLKWRKIIVSYKLSNHQIVAICLIEHLGDIVACEPVSRYIRQKYPKAYIVWCVRKPYRELIDSNPFIDKTLVVHCLTEWIYLKKSGIFDEYIDLHIQDRICPVCRIPLKKSKGNLEITLENYYNFGSILSAFSQSAGLPVLDGQPRVYFSQSVIDKVDACGLSVSYITINCLSNEVSRDWTISRWGELVSKIIKTHKIDIIEVGLSPVISKNSMPHYTNLCGKLSILETAEVIRRSNLFIGVDSGPAQLANAVGTFGIILLGHYRAFKQYMPYTGNYSNGAKAELIYENGSVANITVERVYQAVRKLF